MGENGPKVRSRIFCRGSSTRGGETSSFRTLIAECLPEPERLSFCGQEAEHPAAGSGSHRGRGRTQRCAACARRGRAPHRGRRGLPALSPGAWILPPRPPASRSSQARPVCDPRRQETPAGSGQPLRMRPVGEVKARTTALGPRPCLRNRVTVTQRHAYEHSSPSVVKCTAIESTADG